MTYLYLTRPAPDNQDAFTTFHLEFEGDTDTGMSYNATYYVDVFDFIGAAKRMGMTQDTFVRLIKEAWEQDA